MAGETILILANGEWSGTDRLRTLVAAADWVIASDGGCAKGLELGLRIDEVVGDLDSISESDRARLMDAGSPVVHVFPRDKNATDLELAIDHALRRKPKRIVLFGALGNRIDQTIANLHLLERGPTSGVSIHLAAGRETLFAVDGDVTIDAARIGDRISLIPVSATARVSTEGLRYRLHDETLYRAASRGISNVVAGLPARVRVTEGVLLVVHAGSGSVDD